jgi:predicted HTH transcriptional regulator
MHIDADVLLRSGEGQTLEFKSSLRMQKQALKALCGMVNADAATGEVLFGIARDGSVKGIEPGDLDSAQQKLVERVRTTFSPGLICAIETLECEGKCVLSLKAKRATGVPYHEYDGRAYVREGSTTRQLSYEEKKQLSQRRNRDQHQGPWRCDRCGSVVGILSHLVVTNQGVSKSYRCNCGGEFWPIT